MAHSRWSPEVDMFAQSNDDKNDWIDGDERP